MSFKAYPKYKESGVEWLGRVPEHWEVCRSDGVLGTCRTTIGPESLAGKPVFHYSIPVIQLTGDGQHEDGSEIDSGKLVVTEPQVLVSKLNPRKGTVCIARPQGVLTVCSSEFVPLLPRRADIRFVWYLVQTENYRTRLESLAESATKSHQRAAPSDIYRVTWAFPTKEEQSRIANLLDHETAKIDALIAEQQRLIELLQEKRQAVISHAVTKGLNPAAPMKDSGIEWLGEVPEHWEQTRLDYISDFVNGKAHEPFVHDDGQFVCVTSRFISTNGEAARMCTENLTSARLDDVLMVMSDLPNGRALARTFHVQDDRPYAINQRVCAIRPSGASPRFLYFLLNRNPWFLQNDDGMNQTHLSVADFRKMPIGLPPRSEQDAIAKYLDTLVELASRLDAHAEKCIALLQERRSALISAAVTGQIDVRGFSTGGGSEAA